MSGYRSPFAAGAGGAGGAAAGGTGVVMYSRSGAGGPAGGAAASGGAGVAPAGGGGPAPAPAPAAATTYARSSGGAGGPAGGRPSGGAVTTRADGVKTYTRAGRRRASTEFDEDDDEGVDEYVRKATCCSSLQEIGQEYGRGIHLYNYVVRFLTAMNVVLFGLSLISFAPHVGDSTLDVGGLVLNTSTGGGSTNNVLLASSYQPQEYGTWVISSALMVVFSFLIPLGYYKMHMYYLNRWEGEEREDEEVTREDDITYRDKNGQIIRHTERKRQLRKYASFLISVAVLVGQGFLTFYLQAALVQQEQGSTDSTTSSIVLSVIITVSNIIWKQLCKALTKFELHATYTAYRRSDLVKLFLFKISNVMIVYITKEATLNPNVCALYVFGQQFFFLTLSDIIISNTIEVVVPLVLRAIKRRKALTSTEGDDLLNPKHDLAEDYVEVLYRQFIIQLGMIVFPMITLLGVVANVLEYFVDRFRLVYICRKPERSEAGSPKVVTIFLVILSLAAVFSYPNGAVFTLSGSGSSAFTNCDVYKGR